MPKRLTRAEVERIAALARLELTRDEAELFTRQLGEVLDYAERLQSVDTAAAPASWRPGVADSPLRPDEGRPSLAPDEAVSNAPDPGSGLDGARFFRVPRVIG